MRYSDRLRPGAAAVAGLTAQWHRSRWIWNQCVRARKAGAGWISDKDLTTASARIPRLRGGSVAAQQQGMQTFAAKGRTRCMSAQKTLPSLQ